MASHLNAILGHLDAIEPLCQHMSLPLTSPNSRYLAFTVCERFQILHRLVSRSIPQADDEHPANDVYACLRNYDHYGDVPEYDDWHEPRSDNDPHSDEELRSDKEPGDDEPHVDDEPHIDDEPIDDEPRDEPIDDEPIDDDEPRDDEPRDDEPHDDEPRDDEPRDPRDAAIALRITRILSTLGASPPSPSDVALLLIGDHPKHKLADLEDAAFIRLLSGLPRASLNDWADVFDASADTIVTMADIVAHSANHDTVASISQRLQLRHTALVTTQSAHTAHTAVHRILLQIDTIKFATDWQARQQLPRGKKWTTTFFRTSFMQDPAFSHEFLGLTENAANARFALLSPQFKTWRNSARLTISSRNRLLKMYNTFGPAVLLDPIWAATSLVRGRSRAFIPVLDAIAHHLDNADPSSLPSPSHASSALINITTVLAGDLVGTHVKHFLEEFAPHVP
ncbi:uncharacterized protein B0H18DRAFT_1029452 [Fomitopsis serialis]|uniref:uncharacterized protein n=1 Tax=Fomitopsis serialis TaxID=139415 RepID=UPI002007484B|nr:uncharacterized protein B0H18DRAFT_1029452 [Neoantrodia serialis]KAH9919027.1 hypothetical protein B0H18DRAFT_1029452 [Neoantrodia serialis]